jgi:hypothetical protein
VAIAKRGSADASLIIIRADQSDAVESIARGRMDLMTARLLIGFGVFICSLVLAAISALDAATVTNFRLRGDTITAFFDAIDPLDPCIENVAFVAVADEVQKLSPDGRPTSDTQTIVDVTQIDICNGVPLFVSDTADSVILNQSFHVDGNLRSASLIAEVRIPNLTHISQSATFQVNVVWTASGKPGLSKTKETFRDPDLGITIRALGHGRHVDAVATGTVVTVDLSDGRNLTPEPSDSATIAKDNDTSLVIEKTP